MMIFLIKILRIFPSIFIFFLCIILHKISNSRNDDFACKDYKNITEGSDLVEMHHQEWLALTKLGMLVLAPQPTELFIKFQGR